MGATASKSGVEVHDEVSIAALDHYMEKSISDLKKAKETAETDRKFFDRKDEVIQLIDILGMEPLRVILMIGPVDSGKSALLGHLQDFWMSNSEIRSVLSPFLLVNMRMQECTTPDGLAKAIRSQVVSWYTNSFQRNFCHLTIGGVPVAPIAAGVSEFMPYFKNTSTGLGAIQDIIRLYVNMYSCVRPVIVLDEANMLKAWEGKYDLELESLMHFIVWMTKETGKGHVVMASSDDVFRSWMRKKLLSTKILFMGLGYFSEKDAMSFVRDHLLLPHMNTELYTSFTGSWNSIYAVTGGSPLQLKVIVADALRFSSWDTAAQNMLEAAESELEDGGMLEGDALKIMNLMVQGGGAVGFNVVVDNVFHGNNARAEQRIRELVRKNLIHVRVWLAGMTYKDFNGEKGPDSEFLMAMTPAAFAAMKSLLSKNYL